MKKRKNQAFFGRDELLRQLSDLWDKRTSSLVTCRGRRRVGKSTLVEEFAKRSSSTFIKFEGLRPKKGMSNETQLAFFAEKLSAQTRREIPIPGSWYAAFAQLDKVISDKGRTVVLLDEISWMAFDDLTFPEVLKSAWDDLFKKHPKLIYC